MVSRSASLPSRYVYHMDSDTWSFCDPIAWGLTKGLDESSDKAGAVESGSHKGGSIWKARPPRPRGKRQSFSFSGPETGKLHFFRAIEWHTLSFLVEWVSNQGQSHLRDLLIDPFPAHVPAPMPHCGWRPSFFTGGRSRAGPMAMASLMSTAGELASICPDLAKPQSRNFPWYPSYSGGIVTSTWARTAPVRRG